MPWSEILPQFSLAGTLLTVLLLLFAAVGEPFLGRRAFAWLSHREGDGRALELLYAVTMAVHVLWGVLVLAALLASPNLHAVDLGLRPPDAWAPVVGAALGGLVAMVAFWLLVNGLPGKERFPGLAGSIGPGGDKGVAAPDPVEAERRGRKGRRGHRGRRASAQPMRLPEPGRRQHLLLPQTRKERALAAGMAVTGGVFGELLYRGLFIVLVASMDVPLWIAAVLSVALFSLAHLYQGWWGLVSAGFSGTLFTILYLGTGSLIVPILVHVALNLRSIVFPPGAEPARAREAYDGHVDDDHHYDEYEEGRTGEFDAIDAPVGEVNEPVTTPTTPHQGIPSGPYPDSLPGPPQSPPSDGPQGPPPGPFRGAPQGARTGGPQGTPPDSLPGPPQGPPQGPSQGRPQEPPLGGPGAEPWTGPWGHTWRPPPSPPPSGDFLASEEGPASGANPMRWD